MPSARRAAAAASTSATPASRAPACAAMLRAWMLADAARHRSRQCSASQRPPFPDCRRGTIATEPPVGRRRRHGHDPTDHGAGAGALPRGAADRTCDGRHPWRCSAAYGRSSAMATSPASARRWQAHRSDLPTYRAHNEQAMALAAIGYAKAMHRRRMMACTTSIGPGATNMITAAAVAHVDRLPVLLLPGDVFASRRPDPVLQQVESFRRRHGIGERLLPPGVALLRSHHPARADPHRTAARAVGADRSGGVRPGDAGIVPGRAGGGVRLSRAVLRRRGSGMCAACGRTRPNWRRRQTCCATPRRR